MPRRFENIKRNLINGCIESLKRLDCCEVEFDPSEVTEHHDGLLRLLGPRWQASYMVKVKQGLSLPMVPIFLHKLNAMRPHHHPALLFTDYVHEALAESLRQNKIEFVDLAGNAYLNRPPLYVYITGRKRVQSPERPTRAFQPTGLKLIFLFLKRPDAINWNYRKLAEATGIALGAIGLVLSDLRALGFIRLVGRRQRQLANRHELLDRWEVGYAERLRPKLIRNRCRIAGGKTLDELIGSIQNTAVPDQILVGGELGATLLLGNLRPERVTLHLLGEPQQIITQLRLIPDPDGPVDVLDSFGMFNQWEEKRPNGFTLADPLLIRAELLLNHSDRIKKIAEEIYTNYIAGRITGDDQPQ